MSVKIKSSSLRHVRAHHRATRVRLADTDLHYRGEKKDSPPTGEEVKFGRRARCSPKVIRDAWGSRRCGP